MKGRTIRLVMMRVRYIRGSLYRGNFFGDPRGKKFFRHTGKLVNSYRGFLTSGFHCR